MTMSEVATLWEERLEDHEYTPESALAFSKTYAASYEEYVALYEILTDNM